jgi:hypothetical protein
MKLNCKGRLQALPVNLETKVLLLVIATVKSFITNAQRLPVTFLAKNFVSYEGGFWYWFDHFCLN